MCRPQRKGRPRGADEAAPALPGQDAAARVNEKAEVPLLRNAQPLRQSPGRVDFVLLHVFRLRSIDPGTEPQGVQRRLAASEMRAHRGRHPHGQAKTPVKSVVHHPGSCPHAAHGAGDVLEGLHRIFPAQLFNGFSQDFIKPLLTRRFIRNKHGFSNRL